MPLTSPYTYKKDIEHFKSVLTSDWSAANASSLLTNELIQRIAKEFVEWSSDLKLRTMMTFLYLGNDKRRTMRDELRTIIDLAEQDEDNWVVVISRLLVSFPMTGSINPLSLHSELTQLIHRSAFSVRHREWSYTCSVNDQYLVDCINPDGPEWKWACHIPVPQHKPRHKPILPNRDCNSVLEDLKRQDAAAAEHIESLKKRAAAKPVPTPVPIRVPPPVSPTPQDNHDEVKARVKAAAKKLVTPSIQVMSCSDVVVEEKRKRGRKPIDVVESKPTRDVKKGKKEEKKEEPLHPVLHPDISNLFNG